MFAHLLNQSFSSINYLRHKLIFIVVIIFLTPQLMSAQEKNSATKEYIEELYTIWNTTVNSYDIDLINGDYNLATSFFKKEREEIAIMIHHCRLCYLPKKI